MSGCMQELDWNARWKEAATRKWPDLGGRADYWDKRAPSFPRHDVMSAYARTFLDLLDPRPHWSVLDVGCGTGTLAIPLASRVDRVTAMDFSEGMIQQLVLGCRESGIRNVRALHAGWEDDWDALGIGIHDIAIASRSMVVEDLEAAILKLDRAARFQVCITSPAGDGPVDRRVMEAVGRSFQQGPDYIYVYNLLHQLGIYANITMIDGGEERTFKSPAEALDFHRMLIDDLDAAEGARLEAFLAGQLVPRGDGWALRNRPSSRWAMIWWQKEGAEPCPGTRS